MINIYLAGVRRHVIFSTIVQLPTFEVIVEALPTIISWVGTFLTVMKGARELLTRIRGKRGSRSFEKSLAFDFLLSRRITV